MALNLEDQVNIKDLLLSDSIRKVDDPNRFATSETWSKINSYMAAEVAMREGNGTNNYFSEQFVTQTKALLILFPDRVGQIHQLVDPLLMDKLDLEIIGPEISYFFTLEHALINKWLYNGKYPTADDEEKYWQATAGLIRSYFDNDSFGWTTTLITGILLFPQRTRELIEKDASDSIFNRKLDLAIENRFESLWQLACLRLIFPDQFRHSNISHYIKDQVLGSIEEDKKPGGRETIFAEEAALWKILVADKINITDHGIEIIDPLGEEESLPESRKF